MSHHKRGMRTIGIATAVAVVAAIFLPHSAAAQTEPEIDPALVDLIVESRFRKPADQATDEERKAAYDELLNIVLITDLPRSIELAKEPRLKAQIDLQRRALMFQAFALDFIQKNPATDQEIFDEYEQQSLQAPPTEYKARHILVETQGAAVELIGQLNEGADFEELAREHSTGPSGPSGGDLGWFGPDAMVQPFSQAVQQLEDGAFTTAPVQTQFGWHVILREESREASPPPLESVRDVIKQQVEQKKFENFMNGLRES